MKAERLRNLGILAHIDAGKTTVTERILFYSGVERRMGEVHEGTATMDWMDEERERGITITAAVTHCPWRDHVLQLIDTPGHVDFTAEVARALRVLDGVVILLDAVAGPQAQTESVVRQTKEHEVPMLLFVNKMDRPGADFTAALEKARQRLFEHIVPIQLPVGEGADFEGVLDLVGRRLLQWDKDDLGVEMHARPIPEEQLERVEAARSDLCSQVAELREEWADLFLEQDELPEDILRQGLREGVLQRRLVPALCGSALHNLGVQPLLDAVVDYLPSPSEVAAATATDPKSGRESLVEPDPKGPAAALVFKVLHEEHGNLAYLRLYRGQVAKGEALFNSRTGRREKLQSLYAMHADERDALDRCEAGALFAVPGMSRVRTGDTLCADGHSLLLAPMEFPEPVLQQSLEARDAAGRDRLAEVLEILVREDPTLSYQDDDETGGFLLAGMGELHLEVSLHRIQRFFRVDVRAGTPRVNYREAVRQTTCAQAHLELPGESSQRVEVEVELQPSEELMPQVRLAPGLAALPPELVEELLRPGFLSGWVGAEGYPLALTQVTLTGWKGHHERPPSPELLIGALQSAVSRALEPGSVLLEPRMDLHVEVPEEYLSGVLADLQVRHAEILEITLEGEIQKVHARVPLSQMVAYSTALRSQTQGRAGFQMSADGLMARGGSS